MKKIKKAFKYIGKKTGKFAYQLAVDIGKEQKEKGGFYNLHGKPRLKKKKVKYVYVYPKRTKVRKFKRIKHIKHERKSYNDPFRLPF